MHKGNEMPIPTRDEWNALVAAHGYQRASEMVDCDLDDIPGIEETWIENFRQHADAFDKSEREFFEELRREKSETR